MKRILFAVLATTFTANARSQEKSHYFCAIEGIVSLYNYERTVSYYPNILMTVGDDKVFVTWLYEDRDPFQQIFSIAGREREEVYGLIPSGYPFNIQSIVISEDVERATALATIVRQSSIQAIAWKLTCEPSGISKN